MDAHSKDFYINDEKSLWHGKRLWDLYEDAQTPWEWHEEIFKRARELGACGDKHLALITHLLTF